jgi:phage-related protein
MFANWLEFTIPFKACDPFIIGSFEKQHVGSGTLTNEGTFETPVKIEITGPITNPSVTVGGETLIWTGTVGASDRLEIDTEYMTVKFNGSNAIANYSGGFPKLQPGDTTVTAAAGGTTIFRWRDRWV